MFSKKKLVRAFIKKHPYIVFATFLLGFLANTLTLFLPIVIARSYELLFTISSTRGKILDFLPFDVFSSMHRFLLFLISVAFGKMILDFAYKYATAWAGELHIREIRELLFAKQLVLPMKIYDEKGIGRYLLRFSGDLTSIKNYLTSGIIRFVSDLLLLAVAFSLLFLLNSSLGLVLILFCSLLALVTAFLNRLLYNASIKNRNKKSGMLSFVSQRLNSILTIKSFNRFVPENKRFAKRSEQVFTSSLAYHFIQSWIAAIIPFALYLMIGIVLFAIFQLQQKSSLVISESVLLAIVLILISILPVFRRIFRVSMNWKKGKISYAKLAVILNHEQDDFTTLPTVNYEQGRLYLANVSFSYNKEQPIFQNLTLQFKPNAINLIQGGMGAGKTTLAKLLLGILYPQQGGVYLDGQSTMDYNPKSIRRKISVVGEEWTLSGKTVFEVVAYSRKAKIRPKVERLLDQLQNHLPIADRLKIDDAIGDYGNNLSGGQKMILQFARALLSNKPIILLDAPFDALDTSSIEQINQVLHKKRLMRTIIWLDKINTQFHIPPDCIFELQPLVMKKGVTLKELTKTK